jgi:hypothetical protein
MFELNKYAYGLLEIIPKRVAKQLQVLNYPSILKFYYPPTADRSERKEYYGVLFGIGALVNSSTDTTQMFNLVDGMGDLLTCKVKYNYDVVCIIL